MAPQIAMPYHEVDKVEDARSEFRTATWTERFDVPESLLGGCDAEGLKKIAASAETTSGEKATVATTGLVTVETVGQWTYVPIITGNEQRPSGIGESGMDTVYKGFTIPFMSIDREPDRTQQPRDLEL